MSRHRDIRRLDYDEEYNDVYNDDVYGHSVDDCDFGVSPSTEQYLYNRNREQNYGISAYLPTTENIKEEDVSEDCIGEDKAIVSQASDLSLNNQEKILSSIEAIRPIIGDEFSYSEVSQALILCNFDKDATVNRLLERREATDLALKVSQKERKRGNDSKHDVVEAWGNSSVNHCDIKSPSVVISSIAVNSPVTVGFNINEKENDDKCLKTENESKRSRPSTPVHYEKEIKDAATPSRYPPKIRDRDVNLEKKFQIERGKGQVHLNLVVIGHVDAGKSTVMGHMLYLQGNIPQRTMHKYEQESKKMGKQSFMYAWVLDETEEERTRGITVDIAQRVFETDSKVITLLDAPGHRDFIPNMITGAARADVALLVVNASTGEFEAGFDSGGQTREHAILIRSLGVVQLVVAVNKLDTIDFKKERFNEIVCTLKQFLKTIGFKETDVQYIPCSGLTGENLVKAPTVQGLQEWYSGITLLQALDSLNVPERSFKKPVRMSINDLYKGQGSSICVSGKLETGYVQTGDRVLLMPKGDVINIKGVQTDTDSSGCAFAGDPVILTVTGTDQTIVHVGDVLCDPVNQIPLITRIEGRIVVFSVAVPIIKGTQVDFHFQSLTEPAKVKRIISQLNKNTGEVVKRKPRALVKNTAAIIELEFSRPICLELYRDFKEFGRFMLRISGSTIAAGLVTQLLN